MLQAHPFSTLLFYLSWGMDRASGADGCFYDIVQLHVALEAGECSDDSFTALVCGWVNMIASVWDDRMCCMYVF